MKFFDCHNDYLTKLSTVESVDYLAKSKEQVSTIISSIYTTEMKEETVFRNIAFYKSLLKQTTIKPKCYVHIEDCFFVRNGLCLDELIKKKPLSVGLTWNFENCLAGGCNSFSGVSEWGKSVIKKLEKNEIVVDVAHLNERSFFDFAGLSTKPLFCSHTCFSNVCLHKRNLKDEQIKVICDSGGLVGLCFVPQFLTYNNDAKISDVCEHIIYFIENFGDDNLAFGTDFFGNDRFPISLNDYCDLEKVKLELSKNGLSNNSIDKIFFKNAEKYLQKIK